jgi:hypothetical protein
MAIPAAMAAVVAVASPAAAAQSGTTVQATPQTAAIGQSVGLTATVTCAEDPSGGLGMTFFDGGDILATVPVGADGRAAYTAGFASTGAHTITAAYNGNDNCSASNSSTTVEVSVLPPLPCLLLCGSGGVVNNNVGDIHNEPTTNTLVFRHSHR